ncbi:hypothetical protein [Lactobacillus delbrueckii]|uniref:hypothetical protein n=1 Tax=Lactobacillus delbrueckii TaxID=1584 RepID=UPI001E3263F7|nr:hypothetical protein [Lactobacillus delbrueckii]MCD5565762.1 hypothetical protein [Lactobacillus delbrueckii subsp. lactis]
MTPNLTAFTGVDSQNLPDVMVSVQFILAIGEKLKFLVSHDRFKLVARQGTMKVPVSRMLAKTIIEQLSSEDFVKHSASSLW